MPDPKTNNKSATAMKRPSRPLGFRAAGAGATTSKKVTGESRVRTPERTGKKKACSTPTSDEVTLTDMTLDASCIQTRPGTGPVGGELDVTQTTAPVMKMSANRAPTTASKTSSMLPPRPMKKTPGVATSAMKTIKKQVKDMERTAANVDPDDITDEMMDQAYTTYIQACYIKMKSDEARKKAERDCQRQVLQAFFATEAMRVEAQKREQQKQLNTCMKLIRDSLRVFETKLSPLLNVLSASNVKMETIAKSLDRVKHNLVVQGIELPSQTEAMKQLDDLSEALVLFIDESKDYNIVAEREAGKLGKLSVDMSKLRDDYSQVVELITTSKKLLKMSEGLTVQEQSLSLSLKQLELESSSKVGIKDVVTPASS